MKIASVDTSLLQHRLARPTGPASVLSEWRRNLLVRITTDNGLVGWGETAPMAGVGTPMVEFDVTENPFASGLLHAPLPLVDGCSRCQTPLVSAWTSTSRPSAPSRSRGMADR